MRLRLARGDSKEWSGAVTKAGAVYPIEAAAEIRFTAKRQKRDADTAAVIRKTWLAGVPSGIFVDNLPQGLYRVKLDPADTTSLTETTHLVYDVQLKDSTGTFTIDEGDLVVVLDVTQAA
jgi:hypothetical protein